MKQAWGWLIAGVVAAGLNAGYHDGGLQLVHRVVDRAGQHVEAMVAMATGGSEQLLTQAGYVVQKRGSAQCRLSAALARAENRITRTETNFDRIEVISTREQAQLARFEANRARVEARLARIRVSPAIFKSAVVTRLPEPVVCPRVRINIPRPTIKMPAIPEIHLENATPGPV